jgi:hypothetical protein
MLAPAVLNIDQRDPVAPPGPLALTTVAGEAFVTTDTDKEIDRQP